MSTTLQASVITFFCLTFTQGVLAVSCADEPGTPIDNTVRFCNYGGAGDNNVKCFADPCPATLVRGQGKDRQNFDFLNTLCGEPNQFKPC
ncbi:hypothetical protein LZ30DRAFT_733326 [Colletotrichum cereale]|nr:hypothetical protein LZ30DRAFT_733326 [Colletotrichum cereale]